MGPTIDIWAPLNALVFVRVVWELDVLPDLAPSPNPKSGMSRRPISTELESQWQAAWAKNTASSASPIVQHLVLTPTYERDNVDLRQWLDFTNRAKCMMGDALLARSRQGRRQVRGLCSRLAGQGLQRIIVLPVSSKYVARTDAGLLVSLELFRREREFIEVLAEAAS
jgi:hypothetical protein